MSKIGLIIKREYGSRVKKKSFIVMTLVVPLLVVGFFIGAIILGMPEDKDLKVLVVDETGVNSLGLFEEQYEDQNSEKTASGNIVDDPEAFLKTNISYVYYDKGGDINAAREFLKSEENQKTEFDLVLYFPPNVLDSKVVKLFYNEIPNSRAQSQINAIVNHSIEKLKLKENNIDKSTYDNIKTDIALHTIDNESSSDEDSKLEYKAGLGFALGLMIYMFIFMYGVQVMKGVIEEKTNRIVEVIVSSVKPFELMMGKIIGIMFVGLTQFFMWIILIGVFVTLIVPFILADKYDAAFQAASELNNIQTTTEITGMENGTNMAATIQGNEFIEFLYEVPWGSLILVFLFFFIGGYLLYGSLMAAIGSAVDSETDTQQFMLPVTLPLIFAYIISLMGMQDPNSTVMQWCSQIPFTSPVVMLVRYSANSGDGMGWSLLLSMTLLVIAFVATTWLAGKIYRTGILMYGKKVTYKELFKWLKY